MSRRILVVDDDRAMVRTLCDVLELHGWAALPAFDGERAAEITADEDIDVVLMDVRMPGVDGVESLRRIKARRPGTRVILMTAYTAQDLIARAEQEGALRVLRKPVEVPALLQLLERAAEPSAAPHSSKSLLVVDDDPAYLHTLCDVLGHYGIETVEASTLEDALDRLQSEKPRAVLLDLKLDHTDPEGSLVAIREVSPGVLLILYSGHRDELDRTMAGAGARLVDAAFTKPLPIDELIAFLDEATT